MFERPLTNCLAASVPVDGGARRVEHGIAVRAPVLSSLGPRPAGDLRAGDRVVTMEGGVAPVLWVRRFTAPAVAVPCQGGMVAMGAKQDIVFRDARSRVVFGFEQACVAAEDVGAEGVPVVSLVEFLFARPVAFRVAGLWVASLTPDEARMDTLSPYERDAIFDVLPRLCHASGRASHEPLWPRLGARDLARLWGEAAPIVLAEGRAG